MNFSYGQRRLWQKRGLWGGLASRLENVFSRMKSDVQKGLGWYAYQSKPSVGVNMAG